MEVLVIKFKCIYADCPWHYSVYSKKGQVKSAENHYPTMKKEDIYALPIGQIADDNCILFLWVTFPCLLEGLETVERWGFKYKTLGFCWIKHCKRQTNKLFWGLGFWTRSNPEICIIATKGRPKRMSKRVHSVVETPIEKHSKKPDIVRDRIVQLMGDVPRIELFAREKHPGWICIGNEINGMDIRESLQKIISML